MDLGQNVSLDYKDGKLMISALEGKLMLSFELSAVAKPVLESLKADFVSGKIDLIKGTDLDAAVAEKVLDAAIAALG